MEKKKQRGLKEALEQSREINKSLFTPSTNTVENSRTQHRSQNLTNASKISSEWANIIVKEDKIQKLSDLVKILGIKDNEKIQILKRYITFKEAKSYHYGVRDGENGVKQEMRDLFGIIQKEEEDN